MGKFKTILEPAAVACASTMHCSAAHECEFALNIGLFFDGTGNNKNTEPNATTNTNVVRPGDAHRAKTSLYRQRLDQIVRRWLLSCSFAVLATGCTAGSNDLVPDKDMVGVPISSVGHYGAMIGVPEFSVNGRWGGNSGGWGGGGGTVCCVLLPRQVSKPFMVKVKWMSCDISQIKYINHRSVDPSARCKEEEHEETVPVHFAVQPGDSSGLYVHFLPGHHVEAWVSWPGPASTEYPGPKYPRGPAPDYAPLPDEKPQPAAATK